MQCEQTMTPLSSAQTAGRTGQCSRKATYRSPEGYHYCTQHAKEPATLTRKASGNIRADLVRIA